MRKILIALGLTAVLAATSCTPQWEVDFTIRKTGTMYHHDVDHWLTLKGIMACTGGTTAEVDLYTVLEIFDEAGKRFASDGDTKTCTGEPVEHATQFEMSSQFKSGTYDVQVTACTYYQGTDEPPPAGGDCEVATQRVTIT